MPNPQLTQTKTKTKTRVGVALAFLALAALAAIGANQYTKQRQTQTQLFGTRPVGTATPTFCLTETSLLPEDDQDMNSLAKALFSTQPVYASSHIANNPNAEDGTVELEFVDDLGYRMPSSVEIMRDSQVVLRDDAVRSGEEHYSLDPGMYEVVGTSMNGQWRGTLTVESRRGTTTRYVVRLTTHITPTVTATVPIPEPLRAELPGQRDCGSGTVRVIAGNICDRENRIISNATGIINVSQRGQGVCHTSAVNGAFEVYDRPNGTYTLQFQNPGLGVFEKEITLEPKRVNFRMR